MTRKRSRAAEKIVVAYIGMRSMRVCGMVAVGATGAEW